MSSDLGKMVLDQAAAMSRQMMSGYEAGLAEGFRRGIQAAEKACEDERVDGTVSSEDAAYNNAIGHCQLAIHSLKPAP